MRTAAAWAMALVTLASAGSAGAHHSSSMFDLGKPIWIKGTVVRFDAVNPHVLFTLDRVLADGKIERWTVEGPGLRTFNLRGGVPLEPGEIVEVCGFALKEEVVARSGGDALGRARTHVHWHVLVTSDGSMRLGGYGKLVNCVRETDQIETWLSFLSSGARDTWCSSLASTNIPTVAPRAFVNEINRRMANPCRGRPDR